MKRIRWLMAEWTGHIRALSKGMVRLNYDDEIGHGFIVDRDRTDLLEGRYVERLSYDDVIVDPFGKKNIYSRLEYRQTTFKIAEHGFNLEIIDAPRTIQPLINRLSEITDFSLSVSTPNLDLYVWAEEFLASTKLDLVFDSVQISLENIEEQGSARVLLRNTYNLREATRSLVGDREHVVEKLTLRSRSPLNNQKIILSNSAQVSISESSSELLEALRNAATESLIFSDHDNLGRRFS